MVVLVVYLNYWESRMYVIIKFISYSNRPGHFARECTSEDAGPGREGGGGRGGGGSGRGGRNSSSRGVWHVVNFYVFSIL